MRSYQLQKHIEELRRIPTASLSDALNQIGLNGTLNVPFNLTLESVRIARPAVTILHRYSSKKTVPLKAIEAIDNAQSGSILVIALDGGEAQDIALIGGLMSLAAKVKGLEGAVVCGAVRDLREIKEMRFPVFYRFTSPNTSVGRTEVTDVNIPINYGGVTINPGDIIVGDEDGVIVIPKNVLEEVLEKAKDIEYLEKKEAEEIKKGEPFSQVIKKYSRV